MTAIAFVTWWTLVALAGMLGWRRVAAAGACLGRCGPAFPRKREVSVETPLPGSPRPLRQQAERLSGDTQDSPLPVNAARLLILSVGLARS